MVLKHDLDIYDILQLNRGINEIAPFYKWVHFQKCLLKVDAEFGLAKKNWHNRWNSCEYSCERDIWVFGSILFLYWKTDKQIGCLRIWGCTV